MVVPNTPGGIADIVGRLLALKLGELWGQAVVVENRPGAGGLIGGQFVARAAPDGHTLLVQNNELVTLAALNKAARIDPVRDFTRVAKVGSLPVVLLGKPSLPASDMAQLLSLLRQSPGRFTYASNGAGSTLQLYAERFKQVAKVDLQHIPYRGAIEASIAVLNGEVDLVVHVGSANVVHYVTSGRARAYAVASQTRMPRLPQVLTTTEAGLPELQLEAWYGVFAPAGAAAPLMRRLNEDIASVLAMPDVRERLMAVNMQLAIDSPATFDRFFLAEHAHWTRLIREAGIEAN